MAHSSNIPKINTVYYVAIYYISLNNKIFMIMTETTERMCKYF